MLDPPNSHTDRSHHVPGRREMLATDKSALRVGPKSKLNAACNEDRFCEQEPTYCFIVMIFDIEPIILIIGVFPIGISPIVRHCSRAIVLMCGCAVVVLSSG